MADQKAKQKRRDNYEMRIGDWDFSKDQDFSPADFQVLEEKAGIKARLRPIAHPLMINIHEPFLRRKIGDLELGSNYQLVWGNRGGGTPFLVGKLRKFLRLKGKGLLLLGVGFGPELQYWVKLKPGFIAGTEVLNYASAWEVVKQHYKPTPIGFFRTTGSDLACFDAESFDCVASTAVLEHVQDVPGLMQESWRVLRPGGVAAFSFGPLYHTFGGDHFSGNDDFRNGFNHVLLDENEYHEYLESIPMREEGLADGRVWIKQRFFSYLHADEYLNIFKQNFEILFVRVHLSIKAMRFQATYPGRFRELLLKTEMHEKEPLIGAMDVFLKKSCDPSEPGSPID